METDTREETLRVFTDNIQSVADELEVVALAGSDRNDIDVFTILGENKSHFMNGYHEFLTAVEETQEIVENGDVVSAFPTLHLEVYDRELINNPSPVQFHLLMYPNYDSFISWEDPTLVKNVTLSAEVIYGDEARFRELGDEVDIPPFTERICSEYILSLLVNTYQYLRTSRSSDKIRIADSAHKTMYAIRYITFHRLLESGADISEISSWHGLSDQLDRIDNNNLDLLFNTCFEWRQASTIPSEEVLLQTIEQSLSLIERWYINGIKQ